MGKEDIRKQIWDLLEREDLVSFPKPCYGRIPNFRGSKAVGERIRELDEFKSAECVFCAPDAALKRVREVVLEEGKVLAVALPHIEGLVEIREKNEIARATTEKDSEGMANPWKPE